VNIKFSLQQEQTQKLIITPELRQALTILQLNNLELTAYTEQALLENPLLDVQPHTNKLDTDPVGYSEYNNNSYYTSNYSTHYSKGTNNNTNNQLDYAAVRQPTLYEHLQTQIYTIDNLSDRKIANFIIGNIDESGYLRMSISEIADSLKADKTQVEIVLKQVQNLDPPGIAALNLQECLLIQLKQLDLYSEILETLIVNHLDDIAHGKLHMLTQLLGLTAVQLQQHLDIIKSLNPKPGNCFHANDDASIYIIPDMSIIDNEGTFVLLLNDTHIPRLIINNTYRNILAKDVSADDAAKQFFESRLAAANWLIKSIEQRRMTLLKIMSYIIKYQHDFLTHGLKYLKPLTLKMIATEIDMHESTVSRAIANKYVQTPQGVYSIKFFFHSGVDTTEGDTMSSAYIKQLISDTINNEDKHKPLSDQKLADIFVKQGIDISRRTIAKYRDELQIPNTVQRKRH